MAKKLITVAFFAISFGLMAMLLFPTKFNQRTFVVVSDSMHPRIPKMSLIFINKVDSNTLTIGDIITFRYNLDGEGKEEIITHRIADVSDDRIFRTKPEISPNWDPWSLTEDDIIGKVIFSIPYIGALIVFLNKFALPILIILNLLVLWSLYQTLKK